VILWKPLLRFAIGGPTTTLLCMRHFLAEMKSLTQKLVSDGFGGPAYQSKIYQRGRFCSFIPLFFYSRRSKPRVRRGTEMVKHAALELRDPERELMSFSWGTKGTRRKIGSPCNILLFGKRPSHIGCCIASAIEMRYPSTITDRAPMCFH